MLEYYEILKNSPLFAGADEAAMAHILRCMEAHICIYGKGEIIYHYARITWESNGARCHGRWRG